MVATIIGAYDATCNSTCAGIMPAGVSHYLSNVSGTGEVNPGSGDTPNLFILNPTSSSFTGVSLTLTGYQAAANGTSGATEGTGTGPAATQTVTLPNIPAHTVYQLGWASQTGGVSTGTSTGINMFINDYDDTLVTRPAAVTPTLSGIPAAAALSLTFARLSATLT